MENRKLKHGGGEIEYKDFITEQGSDIEEESNPLSRSALSKSVDSNESNSPDPAKQKHHSESSHSYKGDDSLDQSYVKDKIEKELEQLKEFNGGQQVGQTPTKNQLTTIGQPDSNTKSQEKKNRKDRINKKLQDDIFKNIEQAEKDSKGDPDLEEQKSEVLNNFKEKFTQVYLFKSLATTTLIITILILNHLWNVSLIDSKRRAINHMYQLSSINAKIKYLNMFTFQTVVDHSQIKLEGNNYLKKMN